MLKKGLFSVEMFVDEQKKPYFCTSLERGKTRQNENKRPSGRFFDKKGALEVNTSINVK